MNFITHPDLIDTPEWKAILKTKYLKNDINTEIYKDDIEDIEKYTPIGSIEFCEFIAEQQNINLPDPIDYPDDLYKYLKRNVKQEYTQNIKDKKFIKPIETKEFEAGIFPDDFTTFIFPDDFTTFYENTLLWVSDIISFKHEWRVYILEDIILGYSQYDLYSEDADLTNAELRETQNMIQDYTNSPIAYTLDVGRTLANDLALIEVNDAWATGYYPYGSMNPVDYAIWCNRRWQEIKGNI